MNAVRVFLISSVTLERDSDCACDPHAFSTAWFNLT
jgi:hypothetical protein